jgi:hypothetical protein
MAATLPAERTTLPPAAGAPPAGVIRRRPPRTSGRAAVGALLVTLAALGTSVAVRSSNDAPDVRYVVARRSVDVGERLAADDLEAVAIDLPQAQAAHAFTDAATLDGAVVLAPIRDGALVEASQVLPVGADAEGAGPTGTGSAPEVSLHLPRAQAVDGAVNRGEWVDILATYGTGADATTHVVARDAVVTAIGAEDQAGLGDDGGITLTLRLADDESVLRLVHAKDVATVSLVRATRTDAGAGPDEYSGPAPPDETTSP